jgi:hypothetical protein
MPGKGHRYSPKQDRQAGHVADSEMARGMNAKEARSVGYAVVNKGRKSRRAKRKSRRG